MKEGLTAPISARCAEVLAKVANPSHDKILANVVTCGLPVSVVAQEDEAERQRAIGKKV